MMSRKFCAHCCKKNTIRLADVEPELFGLKNRPNIPRGDALHAGIRTSGNSPLFIPYLCEDCGKWFAIFGLPPKKSGSI